MPSPTEEVKMISTLRGIAALSVFLFHCSSSTYLNVAHLPTLHTVFSWGHLGVQIFFVISGFIIPYALFKSKYEVSSYFKFLSKRIIRVNPPAYVAIFLMLSFYWLPYLFFGKQVDVYDPDRYQLHNIIYNVTFTIPFTNSEWLLGQFWTLAVEFQYYIFIGLIFPFLIINKKVAFITIALFISVSLVFPVANKHFLFNHSTLFSMGILAFLLKKDIVNRMEFFVSLLIVSLVGIIETGYVATLFGISTCLLIAYYSFSNKITEFFGNISYSLYLFHITFAVYIDWLFRKLFAPAVSLFSNSVIVTLYLLLIIVLSYLMFLMFEKPFMKLSAKIVYRKKEIQKPI